MSEQVLKGPWVRSYHGFQVLTHDGQTSICELNGRLPRETQIEVATLIERAPIMQAEMANARIAIDRLSARVAELESGTWQPLRADDPYFDDSPVWLDENGCVCWAGANGETKRLVLYGDMRLCLWVEEDKP